MNKQRVLFLCTHNSARSQMAEGFSGPFVSGAHERRHWPLEDPSRAGGGEAERLRVFRRVRDEIQVRVADWIKQREIATEVS